MATGHILEPGPRWLGNTKLAITTEMVLHAQGMDPKRIRARQLRLVAIAGRAIAEGMRWIHPKAVFRTLQVLKIERSSVLLDCGAHLRASGLALRLAGAASLVAVVATLGNELERAVTRMRNRDLLFQLALDGLGTAAIGEIIRLTTRDLRATAKAAGMQITNPLYPGMKGWDLAIGQQQIFSLVDARSVGVSLNRTFMMTPVKSASFLIGIGPTIRPAPDICEECDVSPSCRHKPLQIANNHA